MNVKELFPMNFKSMIPYIIVNALAFYLLPLFIQDAGSAMLILLVVMPLVCFVASLVYGVKNGVSLFYPIIVAILFAPTIFIFYNYTAWAYIFGYGVIALMGDFIGLLFHKEKRV